MVSVNIVSRDARDQRLKGRQRLRPKAEVDTGLGSRGLLLAVGAVIWNLAPLGYGDDKQA
jgi:hypothetical protein